MKKRLLITGATGMLGMSLVKHFQKQYNVYSTSSCNKYFIPKNFKQFDLKSDDYNELIMWAKPDLIIHSGAITNGNYCEKQPDEAFLINGISLKKICESMLPNTRVIYISTDAVFPSSLHLAKEINCTFPQSVYGKSKELGEFFLINSKINYTIIRTTIVGTNLNPSKQGFAEWILNSVKSQEEIVLFDDVLFNPISIWDLNKELEYILKDNINYNRKVFHIAGSEICTKYEFGVKLIKAFKLPVEYIKRGKILEFADRAKRSTDQTLDCGLYETISNRKMPTLKETIEIFKNSVS
jgi:dTDP-4-dehydrorhamnose reductase